MNHLFQQLGFYEKRVSGLLEKALESHITQQSAQGLQVLNQAMRYATLNGGKRLRPFLVYATARALALPLEEVDPAAMAVELIHCYSLVHDDLPCMDDDALRRGQPTCHIAFGEAMALLAGDALQTLAFQILSCNSSLPAAQSLRQIQVLASASGCLGMAGGQAIDLQAVASRPELEQLQIMHQAKTGALIRAAMQMVSCLLTEGDPRIQALDDYAVNIGLAFQIQDDILDIESDTQTLGKPQGSDMQKNKPTYPALLGLDAAKQLAKDKIDTALLALEGFDSHADGLRQLANYIITRKR